MKVYVITSGEYSDYHIDAVSLYAGEAERICALLNKKLHFPEVCEVEEYDTDDIKVDSSKEIMERFWMKVGYKTGKIYYDYPSVDVLGDDNKIEVDRCCTDEDLIDITATFPKGTTQDKAKKIMLDRIAKFKAERAGL